MKVTTENIGSILQHIYDSEIHFQIEWIWDGGFDFGLWDDKKGFIIECSMKDDIVSALEYIIPILVEKYPNSSLARWVEDEKK